jgi:membrane protease YdiL (CAAX protease family)
VSVGVSGRWRELVPQLLHVDSLLAGCLSGCVIYFASLIIVQARLLSVATYLSAVHRSFVSTPPSLRRISILGARSVYEEAFWRGTLQFTLGNNWAANSVVSLLFTLQHIYYSRINRRGMHPRAVSEFFLFSLVVGAMYAVTDQLLVAVGMHWVRNVLIAAGCGSSITLSKDER